MLETENESLRKKQNKNEKNEKDEIHDNAHANSDDKLSVHSEKKPIFEPTIKPPEINETKQVHHKVKLFDVIVERVGYGTEQFLIILVAGLCFMSQGLYYFLNSGMFIPIQKYYNVDNSSIAISSSMVYVSGIFVTLMMGFLTHKVGRIRLIKFTLVLNVIFHVFLSLTTNFVVFCVCLVIIGACVNLNGPILTNILAEYLPVKYRAFTMGSIWGWYSLGNLFLLIVYWLVMPVYSPEGFVKVMNVFLFMPFITMIAGFLLLKNSPRAMIIEGEDKEGIELLSKMYKKTEEYKQEERLRQENIGNVSLQEPEGRPTVTTASTVGENLVFSDIEKQQIISELRDSYYGKNKEKTIIKTPSSSDTESKISKKTLKREEAIQNSSRNDAGFYDIFAPKYAWTSMLLSIVWILNSLVGYGPYFILPLTLNEIEVEENIQENEVDIIKGQIFITIIGLFSNPFGGYLCELKSLGRIKTGVISGLIGLGLNLALIFDFDHIVVYMGLLNIFNTLVFNTTITYTSEFFPTYVRDYSSGFMNCLGNFGAMISQPLYILYNFFGLKVPYVFTALFFLITSVCFLCLPFETRGTELDYEEEEVQEETQNHKKGMESVVVSENEDIKPGQKLSIE